MGSDGEEARKRIGEREIVKLETFLFERGDGVRAMFTGYGKSGKELGEGVEGGGDLRVWRRQHEGVYHEVGERVKTFTVNSRNRG